MFPCLAYHKHAAFAIESKAAAFTAAGNFHAVFLRPPCEGNPRRRGEYPSKMLAKDEVLMLRRGLQKAGVLLFWLAVWELCYRAVGQDLLLASPGQVVRYLANGLTPRFFQCVGMTMARTAAAYVLGVLLGVGLAILAKCLPVVRALVQPMLAVIRATPVASFIILALVWLSAGNVPILTGLLIVMPVVYANVSEGIASTDPQLLEMAQMFRWGRVKTWRRVLLPSALPTFLTACEASVGMCFKATIAAEVIGVPRNAMGTQLYNAKIYLETDALMAWTVVVILLSMATEGLLRLAFERGKRRVHHA